MAEHYEIIDHTADIGIRVKGSSQEELFLHAAEAMFDILASAKKQLIPSISYPVAVEAEGVDQLMVKWLQELHLAFDMRRLVLTHFWIDEISHNRVIGGGKGLKFDDSRHRAGTQIKAVTYHRLHVEEKNGQWEAEVIFDI
jgi:SHS2 domain-containing protein